MQALPTIRRDRPPTDAPSRGASLNSPPSPVRTGGDASQEIGKDGAQVGTDRRPVSPPPPTRAEDGLQIRARVGLPAVTSQAALSTESSSRTSGWAGLQRASPLVEVAEELRLYLNLFPGEDGNLYLMASSGDEELVVRIRPDEVEILKAPLLRYLRARQMHLALYFDHQVWFEEERHNPLAEEEREVEVSGPDRRWGFASSAEFSKLFSRLCGKRLLAPPPLTPRGMDGPEKRFADFIIGYDQEGEPVEHSADPDSLANLFGANPGAPNYLTPVHFRREVLDRYFQNPGQFEVADGFVRRGSHWLIRMDDDHEQRAIAFLGDLGRDLPHSEQLHWRVHNVPPEGKLSRTARARSFEARFADGGQPEHRFKAAYARSMKTWSDAFGWPLFRPLPSGDRHILTKLHVPTSDNPAELNSQLLGLAKILVNSLNDPALNSALASPVDEERSLAKLERFLDARAYPHSERDLALLRGLQGLRSTGAAHARGSNYQKSLKRLGLDGKPAPVIIARLLEGATTMLEDLADHAKDTASRTEG